jgi:tetratricopeptide (TPR) repeat protein
LYYKLKQNDKAVADFEFSIKLDSMNSTYFYNLALALYYQERYEESCQALRNSEHLGLDSKYKMIKRIKRKCE